MVKKYNIYCDLDGVLVDFNGGYEKLTGKDISNESHNHKNPAEFFKPIDEAGVSFWENLEWTGDGKKLWNYIEKYNPELLSSPTRQDSSKVGKHKWVKRELPDVHLILRSASNKKEFANKNSILIDDRSSNVEQWKENGGIGILHKNAKDTIKELKILKL